MYGENFELQSDCFERQRKVAQSARWGYATTPHVPRRTFLRNGFEDIVCGIHPRELLQIQIWSILSTVSLVRTAVFSDKSTVLHDSAKKVPVQFFESAIFGSS